MTEDVGRTTEAPGIGVETAAWEEPSRSSTLGAAPVLSVEGFEGPLDWLLELAQARRIDLARLSILALVEAFGAAMEAALGQHGGRPIHDLARWGDWLVMTATLALLRSRLLLPTGAPEAKAAASEAEALRRQLVRRREMMSAADWLEQRPQLGHDVFARGTSDESASRQAPARPADLTALLRACLVALKVPEQAEAYRPRPSPLWRVSDAAARIRRLLTVRPAGGSLTMFLPRIDSEAPDRELRCRAALASTLVAGLEMARGGSLTLEQDEAWMPIVARHREEVRANEHGAAGRSA